jgi:aspartate aminotransferase-like enzyme
MAEIGFRPLIAREFQSPIITAFLYPEDTSFRWETFYADMKSRGFVLYPGKLKGLPHPLKVSPAYLECQYSSAKKTFPV